MSSILCQRRRLHRNILLYLWEMDNVLRLLILIEAVMVSKETWLFPTGWIVKPKLWNLKYIGHIIEAVVAQWHKGVTVKRRLWVRYPLRGMHYCLLIFSRQKPGRSVLPLNTQCLEKFDDFLLPALLCENNYGVKLIDLFYLLILNLIGLFKSNLPNS